jgi:hypothetical protein
MSYVWVFTLVVIPSLCIVNTASEAKLSKRRHCPAAGVALAFDELFICNFNLL